MCYNRIKTVHDFFKSARGQLTLIVAAMIVISIFAWSYVFR